MQPLQSLTKESLVLLATNIYNKIISENSVDSDDNIFTEYSGTKFDRTIILLDDQLRKGDSALKCLNLLSEMGFDDVCLHTWTSIKFELRGEVPW